MSKEDEKPLTREDVLRLIEEHGGPRGLDLSHRKFEDVIDLSGLALEGIILAHSRLFRAEFSGSNLNKANLSCARLSYAKFNPLDSKPTSLVAADMRGAHLINAEFREADLTAAKFGQAEGEISLRGGSIDGCDLRGANLFLADFGGCFFYSAKLQGAYVRGAFLEDVHLEEADWGNYVLGEEESKQYGFAETYYRRFKIWYNNAGMYDIAGQFYFREMTVYREALKWWPNPLPRAWSKFLSILCGYGEKPLRVVAAAAVVVFVMAAICSASALTFPSALYYSAASFTALGYGLWVPNPEGWVKALGAAEAFVGVFIIALFLITFVRKMTR